MAAVIELEDLPATDRLDVLRRHMLDAPVPLELLPSPGAALRVKSQVADLGQVHVLSTRGSGATVARTTRLARDDTTPSLIVSVLAAGTSALSCNGARTSLAPGSIVAYATVRPYSTTFEAGTLKHSFQVPLSALGLPRSLARSPVGRPMGPSSQLAPLVVSYLERLARTARSLTAAEREALEQPTIDMVRALLSTTAGDESRARGPLARTLGARLVEYMRLHLTEPDLSVATIAAAHGISERYVYAVLSRSGISPNEWIRDQRLDAAARLLARPASALVTISSVAHRFGFADHAHFSRVFRQRFGATPTEWRRAHLPDDPTPSP